MGIGKVAWSVKQRGADLRFGLTFPPASDLPITGTISGSNIYESRPFFRPPFSPPNDSDGDSSCLSLVQQLLYSYYACGCLQSITEADVNDVDGLCKSVTAGVGGYYNGDPEGFDSTDWLTFSIDGDAFSGVIVGLSSPTASEPNGGPVFGRVSGSFDGTVGDDGANGTLSGTFNVSANGENFSGSISASVSYNIITSGQLGINAPNSFSGYLTGEGSGTIGSSNPSGETTTYVRNADDEVTSVTDAQLHFPGKPQRF